MNTISPIDTSKIQAMMQQLKAVAAQAQAQSNVGAGPLDAGNAVNSTGATDAAAQPAARVDFGSVLKASLDKVNQTQTEASQLSDRFVKGDDTVSLSDVMIAGQKANIALQTTIQVRTKLVAAYNDIMNMQV